MSEMDQVFYNCKIGVDYPFPIIDIDVTRKHASDVLHGIKKTNASKENGQIILSKHVAKTRTSKNFQKNHNRKKTEI
jgi:deoxyribodipyrimidine photo-lyase